MEIPKFFAFILRCFTYTSIIVLIDGQALTKLKIKHNVGAFIDSVYEVKMIDSDFFADEL